MIRRIVLLTTAMTLSACSLSCSDRFENANNHILDTAQSVYEHRSLGNVTVEEALRYRAQIEDAYLFTSDGSIQCKNNENAAENRFEEVESILDAIDRELSIKYTVEHVEREGE